MHVIVSIFRDCVPLDDLPLRDIIAASPHATQTVSRRGLLGPAAAMTFGVVNPLGGQQG